MSDDIKMEVYKIETRLVINQVATTLLLHFSILLPVKHSQKGSVPEQ